MTQETLGYVELEWTCKRCGIRIPARKRCAAAAARQWRLWINSSCRRNKHSPSSRNSGRKCDQPGRALPLLRHTQPASAKTCMQCQAKLDEAAARPAGQVLGSLQTGPVPEQPCPTAAS